MIHQGWKHDDLNGGEKVFYWEEGENDEPNYRADSGGAGVGSGSRVGPDWARRPDSGHNDRGVGPGTDYTLRSITMLKEGNQEVYAKLFDALQSLRTNKPGNKSEFDRRYAVTITDMEKVLSYFQVYVVEAAEEE